MHPDLEQIQRFLHGELHVRTASELRTHLAACTDCQNRVAAAEQEETRLSSLLGRLDHALRPLSAQALLRKAARRRHDEARRWAAGILLALGTAATAWAIPGSPLHDWFAERFNSGADPAPVPAASTSPTPATPASGGIGLPHGTSLVIDFAVAQSAGYANISFINETGEVHVRTATGQAAYDVVSDDRLEVDNRGSTADFEIVIPRAAPRVEIRLGAARIFLKEGERITAGVAPRADGTYAIPLTRR